MSIPVGFLIGDLVSIGAKDSLYYGYKGRVLYTDDEGMVWVDVRIIPGRRETRQIKYSPDDLTVIEERVE